MFDRKFKDRYFTSQQISAIWRTLNTDQDIERICNGCKNIILYISQHSPNKLQREDIDEMEKELGKFEIAIDRINEFQSMFSYKEEDRNTFIELYEKLVKDVSDINMRRISWD